MVRRVGYARVSSVEQAEESAALEQQIARLVAAGADEIFKDVESGSKDSRVQFNKMLELVKKGEITEVIFTRFDRMSRSVVTIRKTVDIFLNTGCNLRVLDDNLDLSSAAGKFQLNMLAALAEMEVDRLSERVRHGYDFLKKEHKAINPPFGYNIVESKFSLRADFYKETRLTCSEVARNYINYFLDLKSIRLALKTMNSEYGKLTGNHTGRDYPKSTSGLSEYLKSPVLRGHTVYYPRVSTQARKQKSIRRSSKPIIIRDTHPDQILVTEEDFVSIERILTNAKELRGYGLKTAFLYPLSGLIYCGYCAAKFYKTHKWEDYHYYKCSNSLRNLCSNTKSIRLDVVEKELFKYFDLHADKLASQSIEESEANSIPPELQALYDTKSDLESILAIRGEVVTLVRALQDIDIQISNKEFELSQTKEKNTSKEILENIALIRDPNYWLGLDSEDKRELYHFLINKIIVIDGEVSNILLRS